jgi:hypothetical protein
MDRARAVVALVAAVVVAGCGGQTEQQRLRQQDRDAKVKMRKAEHDLSCAEHKAAGVPMRGCP